MRACASGGSTPAISVASTQRASSASSARGSSAPSMPLVAAVAVVTRPGCQSRRTDARAVTRRRPPPGVIVIVSSSTLRRAGYGYAQGRPTRGPAVSISRVVCAIEVGARGEAVARQAIALAPLGAPVVLVGAVDLEAAERAMQPMSGEMDTGQLIAPIPAAAAEVLMDSVRADVEAVRAALADVAAVTTSVVEGPLIVAMQEAAGDDPGALLALDAPHERRALGMIGGEPATWLLHETSQPVLLARAASRPEAFPRTIAVGYDGGDTSAAAVVAAGAIAALREADLRVIIAKGGPADGIGSLADGLPAHEVIHDRHHPVHALSDADVDLVVVGSRGLHGLRALGSVSERVAHKAHASVLVVR